MTVRALRRTRIERATWLPSPSFARQHASQARMQNPACKQCRKQAYNGRKQCEHASQNLFALPRRSLPIGRRPASFRARAHASSRSQIARTKGLVCRSLLFQGGSSGGARRDAGHLSARPDGHL